MKWLRENGCPWDASTFAGAARQGDLDNMKWLHENKCPWDDITFQNAVQSGYIDNLIWLKKKNCPFNSNLVNEAANINGNTENIKWLKDNKYLTIDTFDAIM